MGNDAVTNSTVFFDLWDRLRTVDRNQLDDLFTVSSVMSFCTSSPFSETAYENYESDAEYRSFFHYRLFNQYIHVLGQYENYYFVIRRTGEFSETATESNDEAVYNGYYKERYWLEMLTANPYETSQFNVARRVLISGSNTYENGESGVYENIEYDYDPVFAEDVCN